MLNVRSLSMLVLVAQTGCLVDVEVDVPETCVHRTGVIIPAAEAGSEGSMEFVLGPDELDQLPEEAMKRSTLTVRKVELKSDQDLSFLNGLALSLDAVELVTCTRDGCAGGGEISLGESMNDDGELKLGLRVDGVLPAQEWIADITVCFEMTSGFSI